VNTKFLARNDQQYVASTFAGIAANLCALLLASNNVDDAIKYLEEGQAVILSQLTDGRSDVTDLTQIYPNIARRYEELRDEVNAPLRGLEQGQRASSTAPSPIHIGSECSHRKDPNHSRP
jgi:hypothetical protein